MAELVQDNERRQGVSNQLGLCFGKLRALRRIASQPMPLGALAVLLNMDPPNLTTVVNDLERSGLVERRAHPTDRRIKLAVATSAGAALAQRAQEILDQPPVGLFDLPVDDLDVLLRILSRVRRGQQPGHWDDRYRTDKLIWHAEPNRFLVEEVAGLAPGRALDLACGEGRNALWLAERGWQVTAVDFSAVGLAKAQRLASDRELDIRLIEADVLEWEAPPSSFDLVIVMYLQLPAGERRRALQRAANAVAAGGVLLVVGHDSTNLVDGFGGPRDPAVLFSPDDVVGDLYGLQIQRAERARRPVATDHGQVDAIDAIVRAVRLS